MKTKFHHAFTVVELSISLVVIGIIIAGIVEGSRLIRSYQLSVAQTLTKSSPVNSIKGLVLWLDATSDTALTTDASAVTVAQNDSDLVYNWDDQNPQAVTKFRFVQDGASNLRPTYVKRGINNLPTLFFDTDADGTPGNAMWAPFSAVLNPATFTLFIVTRPVAAPSNNSFIVTSLWGGTSGFVFKRVTSSDLFRITTTISSVDTDTSDASTFSYNIPYISTASINGVSQKLYRNGVLQNSSTVGFQQNPSATFRIGCWNANGTSNCFDGHISEIIMFDSALLNTDRKAVEKYLGKKYAISVS